MTKRVLILSSSPRKGGNSDSLCDQFLAGAKQAGHQAEKVFLGDRTIGYCTGCGTCVQGKACPQKDDMADLLERMVQADVLVMATPVYFYTMAAQLKTLIDRTCARYQEIKGKDFYFILTAADSSKPAMTRTLESLRGFTSCLEDPRERGILYGLGLWHKGDVRGKPALDEAFRMGSAIR